MHRKWLCTLGLAAVFLMVKADTCFVKTKQMEVPVRDVGEIDFHVEGDPTEVGAERVNFTPILLSLEKENAFESLLAVHVESAQWMVSKNDGDPNLTIGGKITVQRKAKPGVLDTATPQQGAVTLITYGPTSIATVTGSFKQAPLEPAALDLLNAGFTQYLISRELGENPPDLIYEFRYYLQASEADEDDINFDWLANIKFSLTGIVKVDVPELY